MTARVGPSARRGFVAGILASMVSSDMIRPEGRTRVIDVRGRTHALCDAGSVPADARGRWRGLRWTVMLAHRHRWLMWLRILASFLALCAMASLLLMARALNWYFVTTHLISLWLGVAVGVFASRRAIDAAGRRAVVECLKAEVCPGCG
jgi:hypothetical protein